MEGGRKLGFARRKPALFSDEPFAGHLTPILVSEEEKGIKAVKRNTVGVYYS